MLPVALKEQTLHQVGIYRIAEEIGRGSVAVVYRATDTLYDREVALKVLHPYFAHYLAFARHFIAEGREAARLHHPNIVQVFDAGQADGVSYIAQELISGGTLADMLQARGGPFTLDETLAVVEQVAGALDYAHHQGHLHRNLKPSNILLADGGRVQIADFSLALSVGGTTPANYPVGSPLFLSPEQARGDNAIDQRADIYTLGAIAFLMLTRRPPFEADNPLVLLRKIVEEAPPTVDRLNPDLPPAVVQALNQVLTKRPSARYLTATAFAHALTHQATGAPPLVVKELPALLESPELNQEKLEGSPVIANDKPTEAKLRPDWRILALVAILGTVLLALLLNAAFYFVANGFAKLEPKATSGPNKVVMLGVQTYTATATSTPRPTATATSLTTPIANLGLANQGSQVNVNLTLPPPTVNVLPTSTSTATALSTPTLTNAEETATTEMEDATVTTTTPAAAPSALSGRIAYSVWNPRTDRLDTVLYNVTTGARWPVIANNRQPDLNNQSDLAVNGEGGDKDNLLLIRPGSKAGGELLSIISAHAEDAHPHWSPTNKSIVFDSTLVGDDRHRLYLQQDTNYGRAVGPMMYDAWELFGRYPIFLRDGRIAYNGCDVWENGSLCGIYVVDVNGGKPAGISEWPDDIPTDNLGTQVLMMSNRSGNWNIYLVNPNTKVVQQLTTDPGRDGLATASPDGDAIAFLTDREGKWAVYVMRSDGSDQHKLFDLQGEYGRDDRDWLQERISWGR